MEKLAIHGGTPVRSEKIFYGRQWIGDDDVAAVAGTLKGDLITCGPSVTALEKKLCEVTGAKYAVAVCNGTAALHCAAIAAGMRELLGAKGGGSKQMAQGSVNATRNEIEQTM